MNDPSTRKQIAKEKQSRQSDVMSDIENLEVMLGSYRRDNNEVQEENSEREADIKSNRQDEKLNQNDI